MTEQSTQPNWEERFVENFGAFEENYHLGTPDKIKDFIKDLLSSTRNEVIKEIEEKVTNTLKDQLCRQLDMGNYEEKNILSEIKRQETLDKYYVGLGTARYDDIKTVKSLLNSMRNP